MPIAFLTPFVNAGLAGLVSLLKVAPTATLAAGLPTILERLVPPLFEIGILAIEDLLTSEDLRDSNSQSDRNAPITRRDEERDLERRFEELMVEQDLAELKKKLAAA